MKEETWPFSCATYFPEPAHTFLTLCRSLISPQATLISEGYQLGGGKAYKY